MRGSRKMSPKRCGMLFECQNRKQENSYVYEVKRRKVKSDYFYEFDNNNNWEVITKLAKYVSHHDDVLYSTNIEIYNYKGAGCALLKIGIGVVIGY